MTKAVAVVGAGLAGLRSAWVLSRAGCRVTVLERRAAPGGRAASSVDAESGEPVDTGQHAFMSCYSAMRGWLDEMGTGDLLAFQPRLHVPYLLRGGGSASFRAAPLPAPLHLVGGAIAMPGLSFRHRMALLRLAPDILMRAGVSRDRLTVSAWEDLRGIPSAVREFLLDPLAIAAVDEEPAVASALPFLNVLRTLAWSGNAGSRIGWARTGLSDLYVPACVRALAEAGGAVRTGVRVSRIVARDGRAAGVELEGGEIIAADHVVTAVAPWDLAPLLAGIPALEPLAAGAAGFAPSPIVSVHTWWDSPVLPVTFAGIPGGTYHWVFDRTAAVGPDREGRRHLCFVRSGARDLAGRSPDELAALAESDVRDRVPGAAGARVARARTVWETKATVSLTPGTDAARPGPATRLPGLVVAGDWTATGLPATMEGAVLSGSAAARSVLSSFE